MGCDKKYLLAHKQGAFIDFGSYKAQAEAYSTLKEQAYTLIQI